MKKLLPVLMIFAAPGALEAQEEGRMETDRPDQTESPVIVRRRYFQAEIGFNYEKEPGLRVLAHPTILWKYGLSRKMELRLITEIHSAEIKKAPGMEETLSGLLPVQLGGKLALWEEKGLRPKTSLIFQVAAPRWASRSWRVSRLAPNFRFTMQHSLSEKAGIGYNLGAEWDGDSRTPSWIYTFAPGFNIGKNGYAYAEAFGDFGRERAPRHSVAAGFAWYTSDDVKLDISGGAGIRNMPVYFSLGCSFRVR